MSEATSQNALDRQGLEILSADECWQLIAETPVGRIAFVHDGQPTLLPINHRLIGHHVVFLTTQGSKLGAAAMARPVAFEVDGWNAEKRSGWSVVVEGRSDVVVDEAELAELAAIELQPWAAEVDRTDWVRILPFDISGRRVTNTSND